MRFISALHLLGIILTMPYCSEHSPCEDDLLPIVIDGRWGCINLCGEMVLPAVYDWVYYNRLANGMVVVEADGFKHVLDWRGKVLMECISLDKIVLPIVGGCAIFDGVKTDTLPVSTGYGASVQKNSTGIRLRHLTYRSFVFTDSNGTPVFRDTFKLASSFFSVGVSVVASEQEWGYINQTGEFIWRTPIYGGREFWHFDEAASPYSVEAYDSMYVQYLKSIELTRLFIPYLVMDVESPENLNFSCDEFGRRVIW